MALAVDESNLRSTHKVLQWEEIHGRVVDRPFGNRGNLVKFGNLGNLAIVAGAGAKFELGFANLQHLDLVIER